jgi:hypothetical protein
MDRAKQAGKLARDGDSEAKGENMKVYENEIQIFLRPAFDNVSKHHDAVRTELRSVRERYFWPTKDEPAEMMTQERALIRLFWERASNEYKVARENGYVGSFENCVFRLLYGVFGADILAYLFDQEWVPDTTVDPFRPTLFLERLSVLERATKKLEDGAKTPVVTPETAAYFRPGMGPRLKCFREEKHRLLLDYSLRELRDFGELGLSLQAKNEKLSVWIHIFDPYDAITEDPEFTAFVAGPNETASE